MPGLNGLYDSIPEIEDVTSEMVVPYSKNRLDTVTLENKLGNLLTYPQAVPLDNYDMELEMIIVKQAIGLNPSHYYNKNLNRVYFPITCFGRYPNLWSFFLLFIDVLNPTGMVSIIEGSREKGEHSLGTYIRPEVTARGGEVSLWIENKRYKIEIGKIISIPVKSSKVDIKFESLSAKLANKPRILAEVAGGELGIVIDLRLEN